MEVDFARFGSTIPAQGVVMRSGPWCSYDVLMLAETSGTLPRAYDGRVAIAIERSGALARVLYDKPDDTREPVPFRNTLPVYVSLD